MLRDKLYFEELIYKIESLVIFRKVSKDSLVESFLKVCRLLSIEPEANRINARYFDFIAMLVDKAEELGLSGNIFRKYIINLFMCDVNQLSIACDNNSLDKKSTVFSMALKEMMVLKSLMDFDIKNLCDNIGKADNVYDYQPINGGENPFIEQISSAESITAIFENLTWYYSKFGCGTIAEGRAFYYEPGVGIVKIKNADTIGLNGIYGYSLQKEKIISNTEAFMQKLKANNLLLVGISGSGKSALVKATANKYYDAGLRLVELDRKQIGKLGELAAELSNHGKHFIIYINDIRYEDLNEDFNRVMRNANSGNVIIYASCNISYAEDSFWSSKQANGGSGGFDSEFNDRYLLFDHFGMVVYMPQLTEDQYLEIVQGLAKREQINVPEDFLCSHALEWQKKQGGFSGRTARRFINDVLSELKK